VRARARSLRARAALAGLALARAEIMPRTSRDGLMMDGWMDGYAVRHRAPAGEAAAHTSRCAEYARHRTSP